VEVIGRKKKEKKTIWILTSNLELVLVRMFDVRSSEIWAKGL
jgi:hypothetical protein